VAVERRDGLYVLEGRVLGSCARDAGLDVMPIEQGASHRGDGA
jgi:hypothetical protein